MVVEIQFYCRGLRPPTTPHGEPTVPPTTPSFIEEKVPPYDPPVREPTVPLRPLPYYI